jgi:hypothetical protein
MTVQQAEAIIQGMHTGVSIALQQRFAFDTGTMLRLDNYAIINIFDDGRYYIQGEDIEALVLAFGLIEQPWDPDTWAGEMPNHAPQNMFVRPAPQPGDKRFDY